VDHIQCCGSAVTTCDPRAESVPTRPVLRWHGGKWKLAPWIISHFPPHRIYVEPFGGAASVLLRKPQSLSEVYNDLDFEVVNLFRVLRSADAPRLIESLRLTPFARAEFDEAFEVADTPFETARRLIIRSFFAGGSRGILDVDRTMAGFNGGSARSRGDNPMASHARDWSTYADTLPAVITRMKSVIIENRPALELLRQHDGPDTLLYIDPPYLADTRSDRARKAYRHELSDDEHGVLLTVLRELRGMVILSGYPHPLYDDALPDWHRIECAAHADGARPRTEVLWINPAASAALERPRQESFL
jgi:DNA adenine methylase